MRDGKFERAGQLPAGPMQRVKSRAAALVLSGHLPHHNLGVGIDMERLRLARNRILQSFHECSVFRDVVVLMSDPLRDANGAVRKAADDHSNARRARISQASAVYI